MSEQTTTRLVRGIAAAFATTALATLTACGGGDIFDNDKTTDFYIIPMKSNNVVQNYKILNGDKAPRYCSKEGVYLAIEKTGGEITGTYGCLQGASTETAPTATLSREMSVLDAVFGNDRINVTANGRVTAYNAGADVADYCVRPTALTVNPRTATGGVICGPVEPVLNGTSTLPTAPTEKLQMVLNRGFMAATYG